MKRYPSMFAIILAFCSVATPVLAMDEMSFRMRSIGSELAGIVSDGYTDMNDFSVELLEQKGTNLYTGLIDIWGDEALKPVPPTPVPGDLLDMFATGESLVLGATTNLGNTAFGVFYEPTISLHYLDASFKLDEHSIDGTETTDESLSASVDSSSTLNAMKTTLLAASALGNSGAGIGVQLNMLSYKSNMLDLDLGIPIVNIGEVSGKLNRSEVVKDELGNIISSRSEEKSISTAYSTTLSQYGGELSAKLPLGSGALYGAFGYSPASISTSLSANLASIMTADDDTSSDKYNANFNFKASGSEAGAKLKYEKPIQFFGKDAVWRVGGGYSQANGTVDLIKASGSINSSDTVAGVTDYYKNNIDFNLLTSNDDEPATLSATVNNVDLKTGVEIALNKTTTLGIGINYKDSQSAAKADFFGLQATSKVDDNGTKSTRTWTYDGDLSLAAKNVASTVSIPVGFETKLSDKLSLRLGVAAYVKDTVIYEFSADTTDAVFVYAVDGVPVDESPEYDLTADARILNKVTHATYSAGLGYEVNENINIDIEHFGDITKLGSWRISANIEF